MDALFMLICVTVNIKKSARREKNYVYCIRNTTVMASISLKNQFSSHSELYIQLKIFSFIRLAELQNGFKYHVLNL